MPVVVLMYQPEAAFPGAGSAVPKVMIPHLVVSLTKLLLGNCCKYGPNGNSVASVPTAPAELVREVNCWMTFVESLPTIPWG